MISRYKRTGNVFIDTIGDAGLTLYAATPKTFRETLIEAFKHHPRAFIGITKSHLVIHTIKILAKFKLAAAMIPVVGLSLLLSMLNPYLLWGVFFGSLVWLEFTVNNLLKSKRKERKPCP